MKEDEIRPRELLNDYLALSRKDVDVFFPEQNREQVNCVGCGHPTSTLGFIKQGFCYRSCDSCESLFVSPRPFEENFQSFYEDSDSSRYWAEVFFPAVAELRRAKIFRPRVSALKHICQRRGVDVQTIVDVGAGYGIFLEEWKSDDPRVEAIAIEPSVDLAEKCKEKGLTVKPVSLEAVKSSDIQADVAVCFEVLEHVHDPFFFLKKMSELVRPGGLVMISTLSIDGFDLQVLGCKSDQISPPHHINFLSCNGMKALFSRVDLQEVSVTTPGKLDVDIVRSAVKKNNSCVDLPPIVHSILSDPQASSEFQDFLSRNRLSSHAWIVGSKRICKR